MSLCAVSPESITRLPFYAQVENVIVGFANRSLPHGTHLAQKGGLRK
jgi:hypothetical protein